MVEPSYLKAALKEAQLRYTLQPRRPPQAAAQLQLCVTTIKAQKQDKGNSFCPAGPAVCGRYGSPAGPHCGRPGSLQPQRRLRGGGFSQQVHLGVENNRRRGAVGGNATSIVEIIEWKCWFLCLKSGFVLFQRRESDWNQIIEEELTSWSPWNRPGRRCKPLCKPPYRSGLPCLGFWGIFRIQSLEVRVESGQHKNGGWLARWTPHIRNCGYSGERDGCGGASARRGVIGRRELRWRRKSRSFPGWLHFMGGDDVSQSGQEVPQKLRSLHLLLDDDRR